MPQQDHIERLCRRIGSANASVDRTRKAVPASLPEAGKRADERRYGSASRDPGPWNEVFVALDAANVPDDFFSEAERDRRPPARRSALEELFAEERVPRRKRK